MTKEKTKNKTFILNLKENQFVLVPTELSDLPEKIYGNLDDVSSRILTTFHDRKRNLGVLFSGLKGNSKTVTCIKICKDAVDIPTIMITEPFTGDAFKTYLNQLKGDHIIFIDEFEKIYKTTELQDEFLTILDGAMGGKKMFLFTSNSDRISTYLKNRPNRIFYHYKYNNLENTILEDIIDKELKEKQFESDLRELLIILGTVSYDVLLNLIDEVNRFKKSPKELIKELNIQVEQTNFKVTLMVNGERFTSEVDYNPLTVETLSVEYKDKKGYYRYFSDYSKNYTLMTYKGQFIFEGASNKLIFTPYKPYQFEL